MTWHTVCYVFIEGTPKPQPRHRPRKGGGMYYPPGYTAWRDTLALGLRPFVPTKPHEGPVLIGVDYHLPRPKRLMRKQDSWRRIYHAKRPDVDNLNKVLFDVLVKVGLIVDDGQISVQRINKWYHAKNGDPGAHISLSVLVDE